MFTILFALLGGLPGTIKTIFAGISGFAVAFALLWTLNTLILKPAYKKEVLDGYVAKVELTAANAKAAEIQRQKDIGDNAVIILQKQLADAEANSALSDQKLEEEIAKHEKATAPDAKCALSQPDIQWLQNLKP